MKIIEASTIPSPRNILRKAIDAVERVPNDMIALVARISIAAVFWQSGQTKVNGWMLSDSAIYLFENEYKLPLLSPWLGAHLAAIAEHLFPIFLVIGLASRLSALALLGMTLVIQIFVYPGAWPTHGTWAACLLFILVRGPGAISADAQINRVFQRSTNSR